MRKIGTALLRGILKLLGLLPLRVHYALGRGVAFLAEKVVRYRTDVVMMNLSRAFPEYKYKELKALKHAFYLHFGDLVAESVWFGASDAERLRRQEICRIANPEVLSSLFDSSPSVMVMYSHCGNWELCGGVASYDYSGAEVRFKEENTVFVYKKLTSPVWDEVMRLSRLSPVLDQDAFKGYVESNDLVRFVLSHKEEKRIYCVNTDQKPYKFAKATCEVDFLHQHTLTMTAAAALARKVGMAVVYLNIRPESRGHYVWEYTPVCPDASLMSAEEIMKAYYALLQKDIEALPENYLWTHKRWNI